MDLGLHRWEWALNGIMKNHSLGSIGEQETVAFTPTTNHVLET